MNKHTTPPTPPEPPDDSENNGPDGHEPDRTELPIDIYGIKVHLPLQGDGREREKPKNWKEVWVHAHTHLMSMVADVFGLPADVLSAARGVLQGIGAIGRRLIPTKPKGELGVRVDKAHQLADAAEGQRQEQAEAARADRTLPAPTTAAIDTDRRIALEKIRGFYEAWKSRGAIGVAIELESLQIVLAIGDPGKVAATIADLTKDGKAKVTSIEAWIAQVESTGKSFEMPEVRVMPSSAEKEKK